MNPDQAGPDHERYAEWDAAYVLGALAPADRRAYEEHLEVCPECRRAVAELAPAAGLLSRLSAADAERLDPAGAVDDADPGQADQRDDEAVRAGIASLARGRRRRRRAWWAAGVAAAVLVVAAIAVPVTIAAVAPGPAAAFALRDVAGVPLEASVRLTDVAWGTRIELECRYPETDGVDVPADGWVYALAVVGADGEAETVSTWRAWPGQSARLSAGVALDVDAITAIEIRTAGDTVLMRYDLTG